MRLPRRSSHPRRPYPTPPREKIFPGHGPATTPDVIDTDIAYIEQATLIMDAAATPEEAIMQIKAAFPAYASDFLLGFSVGQYFMNCKQ